MKRGILLQNIPVQSILGKDIRKALRRPFVFSNCDFTGLEIRLHAIYVEELRKK